ncbi:hypothetical protein JXB28_03950 [Candidatus Woesearchaeota archaeon]|nr:hypothetical protein [Candidatus Woesearchaeota archaeon]
MTNNKPLLERRRQIKRRKPFFRKKDHYKAKSLAKRWRRPRGVDNKQRLRRRAHALRPGSGFKSPVQVKGLHKSGLKPVLVSCLNQLDRIAEGHGIILSSRLGDRKRALILAEIQKKGLVLLNMDAEKTIVAIQASVKERQEARKKELLAAKEAKEKEKEKAEKEKSKKKGIEQAVAKENEKKENAEKAGKAPDDAGKAPEAARQEAQLSDEEKKKLEKEEKDKLLTKRT